MELCQKVKEKGYLPPGWRVHHSTRIPGQVYYYNIFTKVSTWDPPKLLTREEALKAEAELSNRAVTSTTKSSAKSVTSSGRYSATSNKKRSSPAFSVSNSSQSDSVVPPYKQPSSNIREESVTPFWGQDLSATNQRVIHDSGSLGSGVQRQRTAFSSASVDDFFEGIDSESHVSEHKDPWKSSFHEVRARSVVSSPSSAQGGSVKTGLDNLQSERYTHFRLPSKKFEVWNNVWEEDVPAVDSTITLNINPPKRRSVKDRLGPRRLTSSLSYTEEVDVQFDNQQFHNPQHSLSPTREHLQEISSQNISHQLVTSTIQTPPPHRQVTLLSQSSKVNESSPELISCNDLYAQLTGKSKPTSDIADESIEDISICAEDILEPEKLQSIQSWVATCSHVQAGSVDSGLPSAEASSVSDVRSEEEVDMEEEEVPMEVDEEEVQQVLQDIKQVRNVLKDKAHAVVGSLTERWNCEEGRDQPSNRNLYIVLDTNVLIQCLKYIDELKDHPFQGFGRPTLVIPWVVFQELDLMKTHCFRTQKKFEAVHAVKYLYNCFYNKNRRIIGQTPQDSSKVYENLPIECNDDRILQCCMQWQERYLNSEVLLFTNDRNLDNKAMVIGISSCSISTINEKLKGLDNAFKGLKKPKPGNQQSVPQNTPKMKLGPSSVPTASSVPTVCKKPGGNPPQPVQVDDIVCQLKALMREPLARFLKTEMEKAYDEMWLEVICTQPPWTFHDVFKCINRHWMAVFGMVLPRNLQSVVVTLTHYLRPEKKAGLNLEQCRGVIDDLIKLSEAIQQNFKLLGREIQSLYALKKKCQDLSSETVSCNVINSPSSSKSKSATSSQPSPLPKGGSSRASSISSTRSMSLTGRAPAKVQKATRTQKRIPKTTLKAIQGEKRKLTNTDHANFNYKTNKCARHNSQGLETRESPVTPTTYEQQNLMATVTVPQDNTPAPAMIKFDRVWSSVLHIIEEAKHMLVEGAQGPLAHNSKLEMLKTLQGICASLMETKEWYSKLLKVNPNCVHQHTRVFVNMCAELNGFTPLIPPKQPHEAPLTAVQLKTFFVQDGSRTILENGFAQLADYVRTIESILHENT